MLGQHGVNKWYVSKKVYNFPDLTLLFTCKYSDWSHKR
jgi:hypothetical protein